jgi:hypothetical protein
MTGYLKKSYVDCLISDRFKLSPSYEVIIASGDARHITSNLHMRRL